MMDMDVRSAAQFAVRSFGIGRVLLLGQVTIPLARVLIRNGIDAICLAEEGTDIARVAALCPGRFLTGTIAALPFEDASFSTVIAPACLAPDLPEVEIDARLAELERVASRWYVIGATDGSEAGYPLHRLQARVTRDRHYKVCLQNKAQDLLPGPDFSIAVFERAPAPLRAFTGPLSPGNALFPGSAAALAGVAEGFAVGRGFALDRAEVSQVIWEDAENWHAGAVFGFSAGRLPVFVTLPSETLLPEAETIYGAGFPKMSFGLTAPETEDPKACRLFRWSWAEEARATTETCIVRCGGSEAQAVLQWARLQGYLLREVVAQFATDQGPSYLQVTVKTRDDIPGILAEAAPAEQLFLLLSKVDFVDRLAAMPWQEFNRHFQSPHKRPFLYLGEMEVLCRKILGREMPEGVLDEARRMEEQGIPAMSPEEQEANTRCLASLGFAYNVLAYQEASAHMNLAAQGFLVACDALLQQLPPTVKARRWRMSALRALAVLALDRGDRDGAAGYMHAIIDMDSSGLRPHLRRHLLDARYFLGLMEYADGKAEAALEILKGGQADIAELAADTHMQPFTDKYEYTEVGNLFVSGGLCKQAELLVAQGRRVDGPWPMDSGLAVASLPRSVDRYGDAKASAIAYLQPL